MPTRTRSRTRKPSSTNFQTTIPPAFSSATGILQGDDRLKMVKVIQFVAATGLALRKPACRLRAGRQVLRDFGRQPRSRFSKNHTEGAVGPLPLGTGKTPDCNWQEKTYGLAGTRPRKRPSVPESDCAWIIANPKFTPADSGSIPAHPIALSSPFHPTSCPRHSEPTDFIATPSLSPSVAVFADNFPTLAHNRSMNRIVYPRLGVRGNIYHGHKSFAL